MMPARSHQRCVYRLLERRKSGPRHLDCVEACAIGANSRPQLTQLLQRLRDGTAVGARRDRVIAAASKFLLAAISPPIVIPAKAGIQGLSCENV
ncbi:hypothetical protein ASD86_05320 [Lysobacter sp. Root690]|nr:hypothetical protein ASD86_05320 [Lysobacter sp. Root690]